MKLGGGRHAHQSHWQIDIGRNPESKILRSNFLLGQRLSHPSCEARRMQSEETAEPVERDLEELRSSIVEWQGIASQLLEKLRQPALQDQSAHWRPHRSQIERALRHYQDLCRDESQQLGLWREDGLQPDEVYESVWDEGDRLAKWLNRMMEG